MPPDLPPYFDALLDARRAGHVGRHVHLGYWDDPPSQDTPCSMAEFEAAQARLARQTIGLLPLQNGQSVLDVACGFGGALEIIDQRWREMSLTGLNIDARQLQLCRGAVADPSNRLSLVEGDACAMPFADAAFDHVLCVEAMFHFRSRRDFLGEAARVLRPGGVLAATDILFGAPGAAAPWDKQAMTEVIRRDYGPWPEPWIELGAIVDVAKSAGLRIVKSIDWSRATLPSYRVVAPDRRLGEQRPVSAGDMFRWLHRTGWLTYPALVFQRAL